MNTVSLMVTSKQGQRKDHRNRIGIAIRQKVDLYCSLSHFDISYCEIPLYQMERKYSDDYFNPSASKVLPCKYPERLGSYPLIEE